MKIWCKKWKILWAGGWPFISKVLNCIEEWQNILGHTGLMSEWHRVPVTTYWDRRHMKLIYTACCHKQHSASEACAFIYKHLLTPLQCFKCKFSYTYSIILQQWVCCLSKILSVNIPSVGHQYKSVPGRSWMLFYITVTMMMMKLLKLNPELFILLIVFVHKPNQTIHWDLKAVSCFSQKYCTFKRCACDSYCLTLVQSVQSGDVILAHLSARAELNIGIGNGLHGGLVVAREGVPGIKANRFACVEEKSIAL